MNENDELFSDPVVWTIRLVVAAIIILVFGVCAMWVSGEFDSDSRQNHSGVVVTPSPPRSTMSR